MADLVFRDSPDPLVRALAYDIFTGQTEQVGQMQGWLALWGRAQLPSGGHMSWMGHGGHGGTATMPGMASPEELSALRSTPAGPAREGLFLQLMLRPTRAAPRCSTTRPLRRTTRSSPTSRPGGEPPEPRDRGDDRAGGRARHENSVEAEKVARWASLRVVEIV
ncbi:DUF305 domain-containing protein [Pseudonocardia halophobica]|uniref:DUF305 domain-containing protein n=1 Tax=Pseudonocardia halophobica TaxID=29401 RepID=UPI003D89E459